ncbi:MAG: YkgJ family cysteine cluster protein [Chitinophagales bacterium]
MNNPSSICLSCGLCCDGTVIGFVELDREELPAMRQLLDLEEVDGNRVFLQPCKNYCEGCQIYSKRPKQCASFKCGLLKSLEQKELNFDAAIEMIRELKQKKSALEEKLALLDLDLHSQSFHFKIEELKRFLQKEKSKSTLKQKHLELLSELQQFDKLLLKNMGMAPLLAQE